MITLFALKRRIITELAVESTIERSAVPWSVNIEGPGGIGKRSAIENGIWHDMNEHLRRLWLEFEEGLMSYIFVTGRELAVRR